MSHLFAAFLKNTNIQAAFDTILQQSLSPLLFDYSCVSIYLMLFISAMTNHVTAKERVFGKYLASMILSASPPANGQQKCTKLSLPVRSLKCVLSFTY